MDIRIQAAIIAAIFGTLSSIITIYFKNKADKWLFKYKIDEQHSHEQQKLIKASIAQNKIQLISAAEELNHRLWDLISDDKRKGTPLMVLMGMMKNTFSTHLCFDS